MALRVLADRKEASLVAPLTEALFRSTGQTALETLWALNLSGGWTEPLALRALDHPEATVREWAVRLVGDARAVSEPMARALSRLAEQEPDRVHVEVTERQRHITWPVELAAVDQRQQRRGAEPDLLLRPQR
jgi:hypothetical protein